MLVISGIEATQATQFFQSTFPLCIDAAGAKVGCPDNSVPLVAEKPTVLRLYVNGATPGAGVAGVVTKPLTGGVYGSTVDVAGTGGMTAAASPPVRADPSTTLQVPLRPQQAGTYRFDLLVLEYAPNGGAVVASATSSITLQFTERRRIRVRLVRIHYAGRGMDVAAPTLRDFWDTTDLGQRMLPVPPPGFEIVRDSVETYDGNFTRIDPSSDDPAWGGRAANSGNSGSLLHILNELVASESLPDDITYVAIYPDNVSQAAFAGWSVGRTIISNLDGETITQELLHRHGQPQHAPCGNPDNVDQNYPNYPAFSSLPMASIGEVGFDCSTRTAKDPFTTFDVMSYCRPMWISPYNYVRGFNSVAPLPAPPRPRDPFSLRDRFIDVFFARFPDEWVAVELPGFARPLPPRPRIDRRSELQVVVRDASDAVLWHGPAPVLPQETPENARTEIVGTEVPWFADTVAVDLCRGEETLARMDAAPAPALDVRFPSLDELEGGRGAVVYRADSPSDRLRVTVRASLDGGATWTAITSREREGEIDVTSLLERSGDECFLEVLASSGYHTAAEHTEQFRVRRRDQEILAWSTAGRERVPSGDPVDLIAIVDGGAASGSELSWYSDLDGELGQGARVTATLRPGRHLIEVRSCAPLQRPARFELVVD
jgi:hypothetical protein